jgi:glucose-6-phosphate isomerase
MSIASTGAWKRLRDHVAAIDQTHLRDLLADAERSNALTAEHGGIYLDYARQRVTSETMDLLVALAEEAGLQDRIRAMTAGERINVTENRAVLHTALRAPADATIEFEGRNVVTDVHEVLGRIRAFSDQVRGGSWVGATGKPLTNVVAIGIGGSYLGPEFAYEAFRTDVDAAAAAEGRNLRFLANIDPVDVARALEGFDPETTLAIVISKTFTTAETMLNARTVRAWLTEHIDADPADVVRQHMVAGSTNTDGVTAFGIDKNNIFGFWDWVGGRYSVCSAVGALPLALQFGFNTVASFLAGAHDIDEHFATAPLRENLPALLGLLGVWNASFLGYGTRALLPYSQALLKLAPHIQQVDMESNGKRVGLDGEVLDFEAGEINFGEPGTNGQHSFYQLIHQGRVIPCDFIGFLESQRPVELDGEVVSNHDELMANFFAQPDALAYGKTAQQVRAEGVDEAVVPHKVFPGNRPSSSLLLGKLTPFATGQLLALYEHRTAVQGFVWGINSFDQWGVELGKALAKQVRGQLSKTRKEAAPVEGFNASTTSLLRRYLS